MISIALKQGFEDKTAFLKTHIYTIGHILEGHVASKTSTSTDVRNTRAPERTKDFHITKPCNIISQDNGAPYRLLRLCEYLPSL
jgi:hypothetical protein